MVGRPEAYQEDHFRFLIPGGSGVPGTCELSENEDRGQAGNIGRAVNHAAGLQACVD